jgi:signal transduction histidine kinase
MRDSAGAAPAGTLPPAWPERGGPPAGAPWPQRRGWRLRSLLLALAMALLLPTLALTGAASWQAAEGHREAAEDRLRDTAKAMAVALDREIAGITAALTAFATSPAFGPDAAAPDLPVLHAQAHRLAERLGSAVYIAGPDGMRLLSTRRPPGTPMPPVSAHALVDRVFATGQPAVGNLVTGSVSGTPTFAIGVPVPGAGGSVAWMAGASFEAARMHELLAAQGLPPESFAAVSDARNILVARSDPLHGTLIGQPIPPANVRRFAGREAGLYEGVTLDGVARVVAFHAVPSAPGWTLFVAEPAAGFTAAWRAPMLRLAGGGAVALLLGGGLALFTARRILRPVTLLRDHARAVAQPGARPGATADPPPPALVSEMDDLRLGFAAAEAALRAREAELASVLETTSDGIFALGPDWRVTFINGRGAALLAAGHDLIGQVVWEAFPEAVGGPFWQAYHRTMEERVPAAAEAPYSPLGRCYRAESHPRADGGIVVFFRDVTAEREAAARLAESEERLRLALEAGQVGTFAWKPATGELVWDERMRALWGLPPGVPVTIEIFREGVHPEDLPRVWALVAAALDPASGGSFEAEYRVIGRADGALRHVAAQGRAEFAEGRPLRMIGTAIDVTPMRRATEILAREAEQLERLAEQRARALAASEARLAEAARMEALGRLAGGIAHDFNNVLQAVQGGLKLAERRLANDPAGARRYLALAMDSTTRGAAVTGRLLSFARRGELRAAPVAPAPLLEGLAEMLRHTLGPDIALRVEAPAGLPALLADQAQLESVLVNLANNARDAMPRGGALVLRAEAVRGRPEAAPKGVPSGAPVGLAAGAYLRLSVVDEGEGMAPEVLARVTEPFFTTKPKGQGTGLGLAMARSFAEQSGGGLAIESAQGRGTTVSLWLPEARAGDRAAEVASAAPGAAPGVAPPAGAGPAATVLLAEDELEVREILAAELREQGLILSAKSVRRQRGPRHVRYGRAAWGTSGRLRPP